MDGDNANQNIANENYLRSKMEIINLQKLNNIFLVNFTYNGNTMLGVVDTACSHTMICETKIPKELIIKERATTKGFAGESETMLADIKDISFGNKKIENLSITVCEELEMLNISRMINDGELLYEKRIHAIIGNDVLSSELKCVIDLQGNALIINANWKSFS